MSERGQKIFKIVTWVVILVFVLVKVISAGIKLVNTDAHGTLGYENDRDVSLPVSMLDPEEKIGVLDADTSGIIANKDSEVQFVFVSASGQKKVVLYGNDNEIGAMHDDGKDGDSVPGDGIYTLNTNISGGDAGEDFRYYVMADNNKSDEIPIQVYDEPTEQDVADVLSTAEFVLSIEDRYKVDGYVDEARYDEFENAVIDEVTGYADENGIGISEIEKTDNGVYILFDSGIPYVYTIEKEGDDEGGEEACLTVSLLQPYRTTGYADYPFLAAFAQSAQLIVDTLDGAVLGPDYSDYDVTFENIQKAFQPDSFIIWHGHGGYSKWTGSFLVTGEMASDLQKAGFSIDVLITRRLVVTNDGRLSVTYRYFNKHIKSLENSFVYLGACHSGRDRYLLSVMRWKGASVSMGFTDSVKTKYDCGIMERMTEYLCTKEYATGEYFPICRVIGGCKVELGKDDGDDTPAEVIYMGDEDYRIDDLIRARRGPEIDIEIPDAEAVVKDVQSDIDKKIEDKKNSIINDITNRIQKAVDDWFKENCSGC